jgi:hypothetical protein
LKPIKELNKMKSRINPISLKGTLLFVLFVTTVSLFGQALPRIDARFANPRYDRDTKSYFLDVELSCKDAPQILFGMNLRFFYDASMMQFQKVDEFHQGYAILGNAPKPAVGNEQSGQQLFAFNHAAAYINGGVQMMDDRFPLQIPTNQWVKAFRVSFKVPVTILDKQNFCPSVIWDMEAAEGAGGFLPGSAGLVITVAENNRATSFVSGPTIAKGLPFNWKYNAPGGLPHGTIESTDCIRIGEQVVTTPQEHTDAKGFALFQNQPNPFDQRTRIEFVLPYAQKATLILFDADGVVKETIKGDYQSGKNQIELKQKSWMVETSVIYYRLQTESFTSQTFTMSLVRA